MKIKLIKYLSSEPLWASLLGFILFLFIVGPRYLNPLDTRWINLYDYVWLSTGSLSFIHAPWHFPFGDFNQFTYPLNSAVVYASFVPWLTLILKVFRDFLPAIFQYIGPWICLCFMLQGFFAAKLIGRFVQDKKFILLGAVFFILMPEWIYRIRMHGDLACQWTILAALCLYFEDRVSRARIAWFILMIALVGMHLYLYAMCLGLLVAYLIRDAFKRRAYLSNTAFLLLILLTSLACAWLLGYFVIPVADGKGFGFGLYSMNLLAPFNPLGVVPTLIMPRIDTSFNLEYEGFNYLGFGVLLMTFISLLSFSKAKVAEAISRHCALFVICILMMVFAWSDVWHFGTITIVNIQLPTWLLFIGDVFRSSGRFFWPVGYLIVLVVLIVIRRSFKARTGAMFVSVALLLQVTDLTALYGDFNFFATVKQPIQLLKKHPQLMRGIKHVVLLYSPKKIQLPFALTWLAVQHHATFNIPSSGRYDLKARLKARQYQLAELKAGQLAPHTLYIVQYQSQLPAPVPAGLKVWKVDGAFFAASSCFNE